MLLIADLLARRARSDGGSPLVTHYDVDAGTRIELSGATLANWVAKTSNLLTDELFVDPGGSVELLVAEDHPGHWMTLVWALACWQTGAVVTLGRPDEARVVVTGPAYEQVDVPGGAELVACSLHPLGLGLPAPVPPHVVDYATEVRGQPDGFAGVPVSPEQVAWQDAGRALTQGDLLSDGPSPARRALVRPSEAWATVRDAILLPLRDGGSSVVVSGAVDEQRLTEIGRAERVDAAVDL